ncbi:benzyl alcohol O-benzoyltransferase-like protein [Cinnamomum micranthum f. kanehirae]|uniref:Benzyl alcohol O-benzoyltransferase-like protein n=1 Tax=Cinnamomum micranthum f. kanehirae TaxID=337451 RepID=A0A443NU76_9MAGN|nr:benzyl alcohol O-benzoyltransferase-like protein [Cinnamomum micranthum f. kanehirae]
MASTPVFNVRRQEPVLIAPAKPTPHEFEPLSDIDDQESLRCQVPTIHIYRNHPFVRGRISSNMPLQRHSSSTTRLQAGLQRPARKLVVECTGEGILFIEAEADIALDQLRDAPQPPFPYFDELLYDVPGSGHILNSPLLLIQLTNLTCGGFIICLRFNHAICDTNGAAQFMCAVVEMGLGASAPSILPVWNRELLNARNPPRVTCHHPEFEDLPQPTRVDAVHPPKQLLHRSFFFGAGHISSLRKLLPPHLRSTTTTFELLTACLWRCRTIAIRSDPEEEVKVILVVNARSKFSPPLPSGYYGSVTASPAAVSPAGKRSPVEYAVELVKEAKARVTQEYMQSVADLMVVKGRPAKTAVRSWVVSDLRRVGSKDVADFGSGEPVYSGLGKAFVWENAMAGSAYLPFRNGKGKDQEGILVPVCLSAEEMERFSTEIEIMMNGKEEYKEEEVVVECPVTVAMS